MNLYGTNLTAKENERSAKLLCVQNPTNDILMIFQIPCYNKGKRAMRIQKKMYIQYESKKNRLQKDFTTVHFI